MAFCAFLSTKAICKKGFNYTAEQRPSGHVTARGTSTGCEQTHPSEWHRSRALRYIRAPQTAACKSEAN